MSPIELEIKKIQLWSLFKIAFFIYASIGLVIGLFYGFFMFIIGGLNSSLLSDEFPRFGLLTGVLGLFFIPFMAFLYGIFGSVFITIGAWIYNLVAGFTGGVRVQTKENPVPGSFPAGYELPQNADGPE